MKLTTDSGISPVKREDTVIIPIQITDSKGISYRDGIDINNKEMIDRANKGEIFKTSSPLMEDYDVEFRKILESKNDVLHLSMSSKISAGSYNASNVIANMLNEEYENKVHVIDTLTGALGGTIINEFVLEMIKQNKSIKEIKELLESYKNRIITQYIVPDPSGFLRSGRDKSELNNAEKMKMIASKMAIIGGLKTKVGVFNGELKADGFLKSNLANSLNKMTKEIVNEKTIETFNSDYVILGNIYKDKIDLEKTKQYLMSFNYFNKIIEQEPGAIGAYSCKDLSGIALTKKK